MTLTPRVEPLTEPRDRTASDVLLAAARYIEEHGWWSSDAHPYSGTNLCAWTAISAAVDLNGDAEDEAARVLAGYIGLDFDPAIPEQAIWQWNDTPGRTEAEVIATLRAAAGTAS